MAGVSCCFFLSHSTAIIPYVNAPNMASSQVIRLDQRLANDARGFRGKVKNAECSMRRLIDYPEIHAKRRSARMAMFAWNRIRRRLCVECVVGGGGERVSDVICSDDDG